MWKFWNQTIRLGKKFALYYLYMYHKISKKSSSVSTSEQKLQNSCSLWNVGFIIYPDLYLNNEYEHKHSHQGKAFLQSELIIVFKIA